VREKTKRLEYIKIVLFLVVKLPEIKTDIRR